MKNKFAGIFMLCSLILGSVAVSGCSGSGSTGGTQNSTIPAVSSVVSSAPGSESSAQTSEEAPAASYDEPSSASSEEISEQPSETSVEPLVKDFNELPPIVIDGVEYSTKSKIEDFTANGWFTQNGEVEYSYIKEGKTPEVDVRLYKDGYVAKDEDGGYDWQNKDNSVMTVRYKLLKGSESSKYSTYEEGFVASIFIHARNTSTDAVIASYPVVSLYGIGIGSTRDDILNTLGIKSKENDEYVHCYYESGDEIVFQMSPDGKVNGISYKCGAELKKAQEEYQNTH